MKGSRLKKCEKVLSALLQAPTYAEAAKLADVSEVTVWRYLKDPVFAGKYQAAKKARLDSAINKLQGTFSQAVDTLQAIMTKDTPNASPRVTAAKILIEQTIKTSQLEELLKRLEAVESRLKL